MGREQAEPRGKILEAAIAVFADKGLKATTIRLVSRKAGVNSALLYYYFENKDKLFQEAVRLALDGFLDQLQARRKPFADARRRLAYLVDGVFDYYGAHPEQILLIGMAVNMHPELFAATLNKLIRERVALPFEVLNEGIQTGQLKAQHPAFMWWSILGVCLFMFHMKRVFTHIELSSTPFSAPNWPAQREHIVNLLMEGLAMPTAVPRIQPSRKK